MVDARHVIEDVSVVQEVFEEVVADGDFVSELVSMLQPCIGGFAVESFGFYFC